MSRETNYIRQMQIENIANYIVEIIMSAGRPIPCDSTFDYSPIQEPIEFRDELYPEYNRKAYDIMKRAIFILRVANIYVKAIDGMISGKDSEEGMAIGLKEDLDEIREKYPRGKFSFDRRKVQFDIECGQYREINNGE